MAINGRLRPVGAPFWMMMESLRGTLFSPIAADAFFGAPEVEGGASLAAAATRPPGPTRRTRRVARPVRRLEG